MVSGHATRKEGVNMKLKNLTILLVLALLIGLLSVPRPVAQETTSSAFSAIPLRQQVAADLKAQGKPSPELRLPKAANNGRPFNPQDATPVGPLETPSELKALVILVQCSDTQYTYDQPVFEDLVLGNYYNPPGNFVELPDGTIVEGPTDRTLANYYQEVSFGTVGVVGTVAPWVQVENPYEYYSNGTEPYWNGFGPYPTNVQGLVEDAVLAADEYVDFSEFDTMDPYDRDEDGDFFEPDGWVDNLFVVHTGSGAEWTGQYDTIWSHSWDMWVDDFGNEIPPVIVDGVRIMDYSMEPEYGGEPMDSKGVVEDPYPPTVGVYAHEFGHVLGLPDEYDYGGESWGTDYWSLMSYGSWTGYPVYDRFSGNTPTHPSAWGMYRIGFVDPIVVTPGQLTSVELPPIETDPVIYRINVPYSGGVESYLLENRQQIGFDQGLANASPDAHGLLIYHIDDTVLNRNYWRQSEAENWAEYRWLQGKKAWTGERHYGVSLIQADDLWGLERGTWPMDYGGHPYPGTFGITSLTDDTFPNTTAYYFWPGAQAPFGHTHISITDIAETDGTITATVLVPAEQ
jgi:M6 family metalloprotease-like protein